MSLSGTLVVRGTTDLERIMKIQAARAEELASTHRLNRPTGRVGRDPSRLHQCRMP